MRRNAILMVAALALLIVAAGCSQVGPAATPAPPTKTPKPTFTPTTAPTEVVFPTATAIPETPTPEATATPDEPPTPTPLPPPQVTALRNVNVRAGPGTNYARLGTLAGGQTVDVLGKNPAGSWYQIEFDGDAAWLTADLVRVSGDTAAIAVAQNIPAPPPTARPQPRPTSPPPPPAQPTSPPAPPAPTYQFSYVQGSAVAAPQCGTPYFAGKVTYRDGSALNWACVYIDYYGPRQIKASGSGGQGDGNWGFSPCGSGACQGTFKIYMVACPGSLGNDGEMSTDEIGSPPAPLSDVFTATITDKCVTGQWTNITFRDNTK